MRKTYIIKGPKTTTTVIDWCNKSSKFDLQIVKLPPKKFWITLLQQRQQTPMSTEISVYVVKYLFNIIMSERNSPTNTLLHSIAYYLNINQLLWGFQSKS